MVKIMVPNPMNKWMVKGGFPIIFGFNTHMYIYIYTVRMSPSGKNPSSDLIFALCVGLFLFLPFEDLKTSVLFKQKSGIFQYVFI